MKGAVVARWAGWVVGLAALALGVAWVAFGWPVLILGVPLFVGVLTTLGVLAASEVHRSSHRARRRRGTGPHPHWRRAAERAEVAGDGLMSGFFEISPQVPVQPVGDNRIPAPSRPVDPTPEPGPDMPWGTGRLRRSARPEPVR